jgi:hypothetical protein
MINNEMISIEIASYYLIDRISYWQINIALKSQFLYLDMWILIANSKHSSSAVAMICHSIFIRHIIYFKFKYFYCGFEKLLEISVKNTGSGTKFPNFVEKFRNIHKKTTHIVTLQYSKHSLEGTQINIEFTANFHLTFLHNHASGQ